MLGGPKQLLRLIYATTKCVNVYQHMYKYNTCTVIEGNMHFSSRAQSFRVAHLLLRVAQRVAERLGGGRLEHGEEPMSALALVITSASPSTKSSEFQLQPALQNERIFSEQLSTTTKMKKAEAHQKVDKFIAFV